MKDFDIKKHGDKLLFALALIVALIWLGTKLNITRPTPSILFTHWWEGDVEESILQELADEFESLHTGIKIVFNRKSYEEIQQDIVTVSDAGISGDIFTLENLWSGELLKNGIMENPSAPLLSFINVFYYNIDILKNAGFSRPPKTRSEFITYANVVAQEGNGGLIVSADDMFRMYHDIYPWFWAAGQQLIMDKTPQLNSRPLIDTLSFLASLHNQGLIVFGDKIEDFIMGRAAFMIASAKNIDLIRNRMGDEAFDITLVPAPDNYFGKPYYGTSEWILGIHSGSANKETSKAFVDFLTNNPAFISDISKKAGIIPDNVPTMDPFHLKLRDIAIAGEAAIDFSGVYPRVHPGVYPVLPVAELDKIFEEELFSLFAENTSTQETAEAIQTRWLELLKSY